MERAPVLKKYSRWIPKRWDAVHEQMVALSIRGISNNIIAEHLGYTPQQVSNVINSPQGQELVLQYKAHVRKNLMESVDSKLDTLQAQAMDNIEKTLVDKDLQKAAPFQMLRASMDFLKGVGKMAGEKPKENTGDVTQHNTLILNVAPAQLSRLVEGAERAIALMKPIEVEQTK